MTDLYLTGEFNASNEYKWALIFYVLQLEKTDNVTFSSIQKDRFAKILLHFFLQLQQLRGDETLFFQNYIKDEKIIDLFKKYYAKEYNEIESHVAEKTYGVRSYLKDCINGLKKIDLIQENPAAESLLSLNTDLIFRLNAQVSNKANIADDVDTLLNLSVEGNAGSSLRPSVTSQSRHVYSFENNN